MRYTVAGDGISLKSSDRTCFNIRDMAIIVVVNLVLRYRICVIYQAPTRSLNLLRTFVSDCW